MRYGWVFTSAPTGGLTTCIMQVDGALFTLEVAEPDDVHDALILLTRHCYKRPPLEVVKPTMH